MKKIALIVWLAICASLIVGIVKTYTETPVPVSVPVVIAEEVKKTPEQLDLIHRKEIWISALEFCESRGRNSAINKMDRDGTPSYSNFQWKPSTLIYYGQMYKLVSATSTVEDVPTLLKDYELQRNIVRHMVDDIHIKWHQQFPDCVKLKVGLPPRE